MRGPVGRDVFAVHSPDFLGVTFEESVEETFAELITHPVFKVPGIRDREETRLQPGEDAENRAEHAQLKERFERLQRVGEKLATVKDSGRARAHQHVVRENLGPKIFHRLTLGEEAMPANVETKTFIGGRAGDPPDIDRVRLEHGNLHVVLR